MAVTARIDSARTRVVTTVSGSVTKAEFLRHISEVWTDPAVAGFDELLDLRAADVSALSTEDIAELVASGVSVDSQRPSRLALCVSTQLEFGLGRMYGAMRESETENARKVAVFHDLGSAGAWLDETTIG